VSTNGYYGWLERPESLRRRWYQQFVTKIKAIHQNSCVFYGLPRVYGELIDNGIVVGQNTVAMLMHRHHIQSKVHR